MLQETVYSLPICITNIIYKKFNKLLFMTTKYGDFLHLNFDCLSDFRLNCDRPWMNSLKSIWPFPSSSIISITLLTSGFCCSSGMDMNSSTESSPSLFKSSFLKYLLSRLISSLSTVYIYTSY